MIIGDVVGLKNAPENKNLVPTIWVTGTSSNAIKGNFKIIHTPLIQVKPLNDYSTLHAIIDKIQEYSWIIFTSRHTVNYFFEQVFKTGKDIRCLATNKIASVGTTTTGELLKYGIIPDIQPKDESSEGLLKEFKKLELTGKNVLIPRSNLALPALPEGLTDAGNKVTTIVIYENSVPTAIQTPQKEDYDAIYFSSPSCVENFIQIGQKFLPGKKYIVQGNPTFFKLISSGVKPSQVYTKEDFESSMFYI
jgi:uroporphyrinogen III methyltransferase/synthase